MLLKEKLVTIPIEKDESTDAKGLSKEELGRLVVSGWTGDSEKQAEEVRDTEDDDHEEMAHDEKYAGYAPETADETGKYYDVDGASYKSDSYDEVKFSAEIHTSVSLPPSYITGSSGQSDASLCFPRDAFSILFIHRVEPKHPILLGIE
ncbi:hypothetical protein OIU84_023326 [Salix udensis]|uniref:Uncharacterized protein n=1 Tax=Salix udensis TaxID=889485 RepID=A0AAD6PG70_9ROSI|nr:hypothetical protein OIU84_023326 [Salix udensis]